MKHLKYLKYVTMHRYYVFLECLKMGLVWRGLKHDISKFLPSEWFPYAEFFHGKYAKARRDKTGYYDPNHTASLEFSYAWFLHTKRNDHHWQYWATAKDTDGVKLFPMPPNAILEMICDWYGASRAQGKSGWPEVLTWYTDNKDKIRLHYTTRYYVEQLLALKCKVL